MIQIITHNVNYDSRAEKKFKAFAWENRKDKLLSYYAEIIQKDIPTIFCLQEVMPEYTDDIKKVFKGYNWYAQQVHPTGRQIVTLIPKEFTSERIKVPKISENHRQVFLAISVRIKENTFMLYNAHFPMGLKWRVDFTNQLVNILRPPTSIPSVAELENLLKSPTGTIVIGDFNTFPDAWGVEQSLEIQIYGNVVDATQYMEDVETKKRVLKTFSPYPYDKVPANVEPYNLDHIYIRYFRTERVQVHFLKELEWNNVMYSLSDHAMLSTKLIFPNLGSVDSSVHGMKNVITGNNNKGNIFPNLGSVDSSVHDMKNVITGNNNKGNIFY